MIKKHSADSQEPRFSLSRGNCVFYFFLQTPQRPLSFSVSRGRWKKPNVCLLSPVLTSSLPPLSPSAPPVLAKPAGATLHTAVERQPQHPQSYKLPRLLPWGVLPAADRTDQRDSKPRGQWPVAVCCKGPGVLHSGPKGKGPWVLLASFASFAPTYAKLSQKALRIRRGWRVAVEGQHNAHQHKFWPYLLQSSTVFQVCAPKQTSGPCAP